MKREKKDFAREPSKKGCFLIQNEALGDDLIN
jgi:hypothetical protein